MTYDNQYPTRYYAPGVQDLNMAYQYSTGNLLHRWDKQKLRKETFEYDALDRLKQAQVHTTNSSGGILQSDPIITYGYDGTVGGTTKGNLVQRTDIGKFGTNGYHRITRASGANFPFPYNDPPLAITPDSGFWANPSQTISAIKSRYEPHAKEDWGAYYIIGDSLRMQRFNYHQTEVCNRSVFDHRGVVLNDTTFVITSRIAYWFADTATTGRFVYRFYRTDFKPDDSKTWFEKKRWYLRGRDPSRER